MDRELKFLVVDDDAIVRAAISVMIRKSYPTTEIFPCSTLEEGLDSLNKTTWDLILVDLNLGKVNGMRLIHECVQQKIETPILVVSSAAESKAATAVFKSGAKGYICKEKVVTGNQLNLAIERLLAGQTYISPEFSDNLILELMSDKDGPLSQQEFSVLKYIGSGMTIKEIASLMELSEKTVRTYRLRLLEKLNLNSDIAIIRYAFEHSLTN